METLLMLGDSLIEWGDWESLLPDYRIINRGFAGETVGGLAARLADEINMVDEPDRIVILSGTNDLLMGDQSFPAIFETMLPRLQLMCPETEIILVGLAPLQMALQMTDEINLRLADIAMDSGCRFLDLFEPFHMQCRPVGNPCFLPDGVHFSPHGYRVFGTALAAMLKTGP